MVIYKNNKKYKLTNKNYAYKNIFNIIISKIPRSIFSKLDENFFKRIIKNKFIEVFVIKKNNKIASIITIITVKKYELLKKEIFFYLLFRPYKLFKDPLFFLDLLPRGSNTKLLEKKNNYLHLLHFIIFKKEFKKIPLNKKDELINSFLGYIMKKYSAKFLYLCYEKDNSKAHKYYKRNNFKIYNREKHTIFVKKKF